MWCSFTIKKKVKIFLYKVKTKTAVSTMWSTQSTQIKTHTFWRNGPCQLICLQQWSSSCVGGSMRPLCFPTDGSRPSADLRAQSNVLEWTRRVDSCWQQALLHADKLSDSDFCLQSSAWAETSTQSPWPQDLLLTTATHMNPQEPHLIMSTLPSFKPSHSSVVKFGTVDTLM